jgi:hypothetical protein
VRHETTEMIVHGFLSYWKFFYLADILSFVSMALFAFAAQIMIHKAVPKTIALTVNFISFVDVLLLIVAFYVIILSKQQYGEHCRLNSAWPTGCPAPRPNYVAYALAFFSAMVVVVVVVQGKTIREKMGDTQTTEVKDVSPKVAPAPAAQEVVHAP